MTTAIENEDLTKQVMERMQDWKATFESKDVDGIMTYYADGDAFSAFDLMPPIEFRGGDMWRENWVTFFAAWHGSPRLEFADFEVYAASDLAFVRGLVRLTGTMNGQQMDLWVRQTNCFKLIDQQWLMIHDHVSFPTDFATGQSLMALSPDKPLG